MKEPRIKYTQGLAEQMKARGVALRESGAYVHRSFERLELERLTTLAGQQIDFDDKPSVVVAEGRGCLVRQARLSKEGGIAKFLSGIVSLKILNGKAFAFHEFAALVKDKPAAKIRALASGEVTVGLLYGCLDEPYASLIDVVNGRLRFSDIETQERSNNRHAVVEVLRVEDGDIARVDEIRRELRRIAATARK